MFGSDEAHKQIKPNSRRRKMRPPGGECHDLWGASFNGTPSHHRVLKPPGGGSSDIFGVSADAVEPQRKNRSHLTSSIFGGEDTVTPARNKAGNDNSSFYNLFGTEPQSRPVSAVKDKFISNIILDQNLEQGVKKSLHFSEEENVRQANLTSVENTNMCESGYVINGASSNDSEEPNHLSEITVPEDEDVSSAVHNDEQSVSNKEEKPPVVSETPSVNGTSSTNSAASTTAPTPTAAPASATTKARVPPGGFSSGLW